MNSNEKMIAIMWLFGKELRRATENNPSYNSAHEAWAVLYEEVDELWEEVREKRENRSHHRMAKEAIQVACVAMRLVHSLTPDEVIEELIKGFEHVTITTRRGSHDGA